MKNDFYVYHDGELYHHGILGQKWGKRNGPPYPLDDSDHSAAERKFDTGNTSKESRSEKTGFGNLTRAERKAAPTEMGSDDFWKRVGKTQKDDPSIPDGIEVIDPEKFAYEMAKSSLAKDGKYVSDNTEEFQKEYERQYKLEMSIAEFNTKQLKRGKNFVSRHSK